MNEESWIDSNWCVSLQSFHQTPADQSGPRDGRGLHGELCGEEQAGERSPQQRYLHPSWRHKAGSPSEQVCVKISVAYLYFRSILSCWALQCSLLANISLDSPMNWSWQSQRQSQQLLLLKKKKMQLSESGERQLIVGCHSQAVKYRCFGFVDNLFAHNTISPLNLYITNVFYAVFTIKISYIYP